MNRIEELIKEKCPDGVEYIRLEELCSNITKQTGFDYSSTIKPALVKEASQDTYAFIQNKDFDGDKINLNTDYYIPIAVAEKYPKITLDTPSLLISLSGKVGNVGFYGLDSKAFIGGAVGICKLKDGIVGKFVMHYLMSSEGQKYLFKSVKAASHVNLTVESIRDTPIPVPPIEVQQEIVRILDKFTELEAELQAELDARNKQYENYREELFTNRFFDKVEYKKIKSVCSEVIVPMRDKPQVFDGEIPWCRIEDIEGQYFNDSLSGLRVSEKIIKEMNLKVFPKGTVICSCSASIGVYAINTQPLITNQTFIGIVCGKEVINKFLLYYMQTQTPTLLRLSTTGTIPYISRNKFENLEIPVPSIMIQQDVIRVLDKFTELVAGLQDELEMRHKQYEYYRDKLLTFERKVV